MISSVSRPPSTLPPEGTGPAGVPSSTASTASAATKSGAGRAGGRHKEPLDLTDLKEGRVEGAPYLKGELQRDVQGDHIFKGAWAMSYAGFHGPDAVTSEFELKHKSLDPDDTEIFPFGGAYSGWYKLKEQGGRKDMKHEEREVQLAFQRNSAGGYNVEGLGRNQYGQYKIKGLLTEVKTDTALCEIFRIYQPVAAPPPQPRAPPAPPIHSSAAAAAGRRSSNSKSVPFPHTGTDASKSQPPPAQRPGVPTARAGSGSAAPYAPMGDSSHGLGSARGGAGERAAAAKKRASSGSMGGGGVGGGGGLSRKSTGGAGAGGRGVGAMGGNGANRVISEKMARRCWQMLKDLKDRGQQACNWFLRPVTEEEAPGYFQVIENPMDLATVDKKLRHKLHRDLHDFAADVRLVFTNAMRFNPAESSVYLDAQKLMGIFNDMYRKACADLKTNQSDAGSLASSVSSGGGIGKAGAGRKKAEPVGPRAGMAMAPQHASQAFREPGADANPLATAMVEKYKNEMNIALTQLVKMERENTVLRAKLASAQKRSEELEREVAELRGGAAGGQGAGATSAQAAAETEPVTKEERDRLVTYVQAIADSGNEELARNLTELIKQHHPPFGEGGNYSINVYAYDDETVRALLAYCEPLFETEVEGEEGEDREAGSAKEQEQALAAGDEDGAREELSGQENGHVPQQEKRDRPEEVEREGGEKRQRTSSTDMEGAGGGEASAILETGAERSGEGQDLEGEMEKAEVKMDDMEDEEAAAADEEEAGNDEDTGGASTLQKWLAPGATATQEGEAGGDEDAQDGEGKVGEGGVGGSGAEGNIAGDEGGMEKNDLWDAARQMKEEELKREKERATEEAERQQALLREEEKRKAELAEEEERLRKERQEKEEAEKRRVEEEAAKKAREIREAREKARLDRQREEG